MCGENKTPKRWMLPSSGSPPRVRGKLSGETKITFTKGITPACAGKTYRIQFRQSPCWDHPRVCGENFGFSTMYFLMPGSPPRVRGKLFELLSDKVLDGITPACAGKTAARVSNLRVSRDHPRVCGENQACPSSFRPRPGSPPRVRGKPALHQLPHARYGITPACAGKTSTFRSGKSALWDHPRVCGENESMAYWESYEEGSPPRVRGKQDRDAPVYTLTGITPACAGKTCNRDFGISWSKDHPRVCGENQRSAVSLPLKKGSPPRVRGKLPSALNRELAEGITPACAGKTIFSLHPLHCYRDHPRVCGENKSSSCPISGRLGSPPRVRGKPQRIHVSGEQYGITPACAGKTPSKSSCLPCAGDHPRVCGENHGKSPFRWCDVDHPRVCGENPLIIESDYRLQGSPPRVRGKLLTTFYGQSIGGITPACAGKTSSRPSPRKAYRDHPRVCGENER